MVENFFSDATAPFAVALCLMALIALVELVGALMGMAPSDLLDNLLPEVELDTDLEVDADFEMELDGGGSPLDADSVNLPDVPNQGPLTAILGWLCIGKVPILVLLVVYLTAFGVSGFAVQGVSDALIGLTLPSMIAVIPAFIAAVFTTRWAGLGLAKVMPKEQTEAVSQKAFVGRIVTIVRGEAKFGLPAEAKLTDKYGQTHYVMVEPDDDTATFAAGEDVLIVKQVGGARYRVIANPNPHLTDT